MKLKHNKKRNVGFIYEVLIKQLSKASMQKSEEKKQKVIKILKTFFSKNAPLREELNIYQSFEDIHQLDERTAQKIIFEARHQASMLNHKNINENKSRIINLINKELGQDSWDTFVKGYKRMATINQAIFSKLSPKRQVFVENKLLDIMISPETEKKQFPNVNNMALKTFLNNFNSQYAETLNESQKNLLEKYITSNSEDNLELKIYLYDEIDRLKTNLNENIGNNNVDTKKIKLILEKMHGYSTCRIDKNMITEIVKIQSLVDELNNADNA